MNDKPDFYEEQREAVLRIMKFCRGRSRAIHVDELVQLVMGLAKGDAGYPGAERAVRKICDELTVDGMPVVSTSSEGLFVPANALEVEEAYERYRKPGLAHLSRAARLRKMALPELLGQLKIELNTEGGV